MLTPTFDEVAALFGSDEVKDHYFRHFLHANDQDGALGTFCEDDPDDLGEDIFDGITPDEYGPQADTLRQTMVTLARQGVQKWRGGSCVLLPWVAGESSRLRFAEEMAPLGHTLKEADRLLRSGSGVNIVIFSLICKPVFPSGIQSPDTQTLMHAVLVLRTRTDCFFVDDNGDYTKSKCNYYPWNPCTHGKVRRLGQPHNTFEEGFSTALDVLMASAGCATKRLCQAYVARAASMIVQDLDEGEVEKMLRGPNGDRVMYCNRVHSPIFDEVQCELWSTLRSLPCSLFHVPSFTISSSLLICRLAAKQLTAVQLHKENVVAVRKETASDGTITIRTTAPGDVMPCPSSEVAGNRLQVKVRWSTSNGRKGPWKTVKLSDGTKIAVVLDDEGEVYA